MKNIIKRYEKKYVIDALQYELFMHFVQGKLTEDQRSRYTISNLYYDTDDYELIRASIEKPVYKEKLRIRTYEAPWPGAAAYIELKKKVEGIVYKRRFETDLTGGAVFLGGGAVPVSKPEDKHVIEEIKYFLSRHDVGPKAFISYERQCFHGAFDPEFRVTFDTDITFSDPKDVSSAKPAGRPVLEPEKMIMEIKTPSAMPVWLSKIMSELDIYPSSFSKYGQAYKAYVCNQVFRSLPLASSDAGFKKKEVGLSA